MIDANERAYNCLQWHSPVQLAPYDESIDYVTIQKKRSDAALDAFDEEHPYETSDELKAFQYLERLRVYNQSDYYLPSKAKDGYYTKRLRAHQHQTRSSGGSRQGPPSASRIRRYGHQ